MKRFSYIPLLSSKMLENLSMILGDVQRDPKSNSGSLWIDLGSPKCDHGSPWTDNGSLKCDHGSMKSNSGSPRSNFGSPWINNGYPWINSGSPWTDNGSPCYFFRIQRVPACTSHPAHPTVRNKDSVPAPAPASAPLSLRSASEARCLSEVEGSVVEGSVVEGQQFNSNS
jgi:hypothetical protein